MTVKYLLGVSDLVVLSITLVIPLLIGFKFKSSGSEHGSPSEYFLAGKNAGLLVVVTSTTVTILSAIVMISTSAEIYKFGPMHVYFSIGLCIGSYFASYMFTPIYFRCKVSSIYELLEMRFGKYTRYAISAVFIVQTMLYMCAVLLGPVLALNAVTNFSMQMAIIAFGAVCTIYCVMGGLKAVLWTDAFQAVLMITVIIIVYVVGISEVGSVTEIIRRASEGKRLNFFDFRLDFETRYTFWNCFFRGVGFGLAFWGCSQLEVQRALSMSSLSRAQSSIRWSTLSLFSFQIICNLIGILIYAVFYLCDPVLMYRDTGITKYDQIVPYFIISRLHSIPGLTGLCIAGIFSGSLSTMSSALNSLATVTVVDFVQPAIPSLTEFRTVTIAKFLVISLFYGLLCIGIAFFLAEVDSLMQAAIVFMSYTEGPVLAVFLIAVLTRKASDKSAFLGLSIGVCLVSWLGFGSLFGGFRHPHLPLETSACPAYANVTSSLLNNSTTICSASSNCTLETVVQQKEIFALYKMLLLNFISTIGCLTTVTLVLIFSLILDGNKNVIPPDSKCLSPLVEFLMKSVPIQEIKEKEIQMKNINTLNLSQQSGV
ncbi:hypothetical protein JTE90_000318 [Oedothorax gibbosus]|uniref:Sodium-coupled monocarboxylate transporter 1 n=1 Tax=Oedothorax gibbosus TaxID=931172 RepID=A0AAV6VVF4_9ARAC|nr:hypothetical protein JTE90_000318 [Oedothorax gibbosus]